MPATLHRIGAVRLRLVATAGEVDRRDRDPSREKAGCASSRGGGEFGVALGANEVSLVLLGADGSVILDGGLGCQVVEPDPRQGTRTGPGDPRVTHHAPDGVNSVAASPMPATRMTCRQFICL